MDLLKDRALVMFARLFDGSQEALDFRFLRKSQKKSPVIFVALRSAETTASASSNAWSSPMKTAWIWPPLWSRAFGSLKFRGESAFQAPPPSRYWTW